MLQGVFGGSIPPLWLYVSRSHAIVPLQSTHQLMKWEMHQPCKAPTPAQALGLTPLPDPSSPADALEASMALRSSAEGAGVPAADPQTLVAP